MGGLEVSPLRLPVRIFLPVAAAALMCGCRQEAVRETDKAEPPEEANVARSSVERGPIRLTVELEPKEMRLSDEATLTLLIESEPGVDVEKPPFGTALGEFVIRDFDEPLVEVEEGRDVVKQIYTLEPPARSGEVVIEPISVRFTDRRPDGDGKQHTVETEGLTAQIAEVSLDDVPSLDDMLPAAGPVELTAEDVPTNWWPWGSLAAIALAGGGLIWWWRARRRKASRETPPQPREMAYLELQALLEADLAVKDVKLYYVELTAVVRRYIERTTGIRAPEQTTEEFLREIGTVAAFSEQEAQRLKDFLESADLVKFAAHQPRTEDIRESFDRAKTFIGLDRGASQESLVDGGEHVVAA